MTPYEKTCRNCGAVHYVTETKVIVRDRDADECGVCGETVADGNGWRVVSFKRGTRPDDR